MGYYNTKFKIKTGGNGPICLIVNAREDRLMVLIEIEIVKNVAR